MAVDTEVFDSFFVVQKILFLGKSFYLLFKKNFF